LLAAPLQALLVLRLLIEFIERFVKTGLAHGRCRSLEQVALTMKALEVALVVRAQILRETLVLVAHAFVLGMDPFIQVDHALDASLDRLLEAGEARSVGDIERRLIGRNSRPRGRHQGVGLGVDAGADIEVLLVVAQRRIGHLRLAARLQELAIATTDAAAVETVRVAGGRPVEAGADDAIAADEHRANVRARAVGSRRDRERDLHVVVVPLNVCDTLDDLADIR
jgi:hypothetical protein